ncbi:uncharacterized protein TNCV_2317391 [Trichonephila clavipes]|nr:uncharacterized protein TNCV_2317391 [Trichonephila clavipes]
MVSFLDVTGIKPCPDLSPNQNALRIASGTEPTLIRKEDTTPLTVVQFFVLSAPLCSPWAATTNLSNSCTCGLERFPSARNDTFVDSELCSYTGDDNMLTKYRMIKFIDFCEVGFLPESVARVAIIVGDHRCDTPWHLFRETLDVFLGYSKPSSFHTLPKLIWCGS